MSNSFKNNGVAGIGISYVNVYSPPVSPSGVVATVIGLTVANIHTETVYIDAILAKPGGQFFIIKSAPVPVGGSLLLCGGDQKVVVQQGDSIRIKSNVAASVDAIVSYLELS